MTPPILRRRQTEYDRWRAAWPFERIAALWRERVAAHGADPTTLFTSVAVHDPGIPDRPSETAWWPAQDVAARRRRLQAFFDWAPGRRGPIHDLGERDGVKATADAMQRHRDDPAAMAAIFVAGALWPSLGTSRGGASYHGDPFSATPARRIFEEATGEILSRDGRLPWFHWNTSVLPRVDTFGCGARRLDDTESLMDEIAWRSALVIQSHRCVDVQFLDRPDPGLRAEMTIDDAARRVRATAQVIERTMAGGRRRTSAAPRPSDQRTSARRDEEAR